MNSSLKKSQGGYVILVSILLIGAVGSAITVSILLLGLGSSRTNFALQQMYQAKGLANLCAEEALQQIRASTGFSGSNNLSIGQGTCTYTVSDDGGENRTIVAQGSIGSIVRKVHVNVVAINPLINVSSWQEVAN